MKSSLSGGWCLALLACTLAAAAELPPKDKEDFLRTARIISHKYAGTGITESQHATLEKDGFRHDGHIQTVDVAMTKFETARGTEMNFRDTYKFNIAAYELAKLLGIGDMVPPSVCRRVPGGKEGAVTWWVDDVLCVETDRIRKKMQPPDPDRWNCQMHVVRVFDQLIANTDRNLGNLVIDKNWHVWMIDHTRAFRTCTDPPTPKNLVKCDRHLLVRLRELTRAELDETLGHWLTPMEIAGILKRRDKIVERFDAAVKRSGEAAVLYDRPALGSSPVSPAPRALAGREGPL